MKRSLALAISAVLAASLATACGKDSDSSSSGTGKAASTASSTEAAANKAAEGTSGAVASAPVTTGEQDPTEPDNYSHYENPTFANPNDDASNGELMAELSMKADTIPSDADGFKIKDGILYGYDGVENELHIPDSVTRIESWAFKNDDNIRAVYIPSSVKSIGAFVFDCSSALRFVDIAEGVETIGDSSFSRCSSLTDINLPASLRSVGEPAFWANGELTIHAREGTYAEKLASSHYGDFVYSSSPAIYEPINLNSVIRANQYEYGDFTEFEIPANITGIEGEAFQYCEQLKSITIPSNVKFIGGSAFEYCDSLETVRIEEGCESIGSSAFAYVPKLKEVWLPASLNKIDRRAFEYYGDSCVFHVPSGSYAEKFAIKYNMNYDNNV